jgi:hypothetical protein
MQRHVVAPTHWLTKQPATRIRTDFFDLRLNFGINAEQQSNIRETAGSDDCNLFFVVGVMIADAVKTIIYCFGLQRTTSMRLHCCSTNAQKQQSKSDPQR